MIHTDEQVEALKAAEAARRKEAHREAERERQREALRKQKADRAKHTQHVKVGSILSQAEILHGPISCHDT